MNLINNSIRVLVIALLLIAIAGNANAQFGVQFSRVIPKGDIGQYFNKGNSIDAYLIGHPEKHDNWEIRFGYFYTKLSTRIDTVPEYMVQTGGLGTVVYPGYLVNHNFSMQYIVADISCRVVNVHGFGWYLGAGIIGGKSHVDYERGFQTLLVETTSTDVLIAGLKVSSRIAYCINPHFDVYLEGSKNMVTAIDYSTTYSHYKLGAGVNYFIKKRE